MEKIFIPHELKTIEVDVEKKIFRINGEDFGKVCTGFTLVCEAGKEDFFHVQLSMDTRMHFIYYDRKGRKLCGHSVERTATKT